MAARGEIIDVVVQRVTELARDLRPGHGAVEHAVKPVLSLSSQSAAAGMSSMFASMCVSTSAKRTPASLIGHRLRHGAAVRGRGPADSRGRRFRARRSRCGTGPISMRNRTDLDAEPDRSRAELRPISMRNATDLGEGSRPRRPQPSLIPSRPAQLMLRTAHAPHNSCSTTPHAPYSAILEPGTASISSRV